MMKSAKIKWNGRGEFKRTLWRYCSFFIVIIATMTSPYDKNTAVASDSQPNKYPKNINFTKEHILLKLLESCALTPAEIKIEASFGDLLKQEEFKDLKAVKAIGKARIISSGIPRSQESQPQGSQTQGSQIQGSQTRESQTGELQTRRSMTHGIVQVVWNQLSIKGKTQSLQKPLTSSFKTRSSRFEAGSLLKAHGDIETLLINAQKLVKGEQYELPVQSDLPKITLSNERRVDESLASRNSAQSRTLGTANQQDSTQSHSSLGYGPSLAHGGASSSKAAANRRKPASGGHRQAEERLQLSNTAPSPQSRRRGQSNQATPSSTATFAGLNGSSSDNLTSGNNLNAANHSGSNRNLAREQEASESEYTSSTTEVRLTQEGCTPRVDLVQGRVVIRSRVQTFQDGNMIKEDPCTDTLETYPIKKDYRCEDCTDLVDFERRVAYARFRYYWLDGEERRHEISAHLETDETRPFPFIEDPALCAPELDIPHNLAYRQAETVYFNRSNGRIKVAECRRLQGAPPVPMTLTHQGCTPVHDFAANRSKERKRLIFNVDGIEHVALPCHKADPALAHEFVTSVCAPIHDLSRNLVTPMARRRIRTSQGLEFITDECEPYGQSQALKSTAQGCEGEYVHDFEAGKSYLKKRWYHTLGGSPSYLTGCLRSDDFLTHQIEIKGYRHDDPAKVSRPKTALFITPHQSQKIEISRPQVRSNAPTTPYVLVREEQRPSARQPTVEGGYRLTHVDKVHIYRRADSSIFEIVAGEGTPRRDLIAAVPPAVIAPPTPEVGQRETEMSYSAEYKVDRGRRWNSGIVDSSMTFDNLRTATAVFGAHQGEIARLYTRRLGQSRTKITYPSGRVEYTGWQSVGPVSDWSLMNKRD